MGRAVMFMLSLVSSGVLALWLEATGILPPPSEVSVPLLEAPPLVLSLEANAEAEALIDRYLTSLEAQGMSPQRQGIWLQAGAEELASHQATLPRSAASITKVATTLVALDTWDWQQQTVTEISATGPIVNGVLEGHLIITGGGDLLWVWEEAIALAVTLQELGIERVAGDLILEDQPWFNFRQEAERVGEGFRLSFDSRRWTPRIERAHEGMAAGTPRPQLEIRGEVRRLGEPETEETDGENGGVERVTEPLPSRVLLVRHHSLPLLSWLKVMNVHSNNVIADHLAEELGGGARVAQRAAQLAAVPEAEIQLINGSGLGQENRVSPRASVALLGAIHRRLARRGLTVADLFPVFGQDGGTMEDREMPKGATVKTGTLWNVSALVGAVPTRDRGLVWFALLNGGDAYTLPFRRQQDEFLQQIQEQWGQGPQPRALRSFYPLPHFGDRDRLEVLVESELEASQSTGPYPSARRP